MAAPIKTPVRDLPRSPDSGIAQCVSYDSATTMSQMSHYSATKNVATATSSVLSQLPRATPVTARQTPNATTLPHNCGVPPVRRYKSRASDATVVCPARRPTAMRLNRTYTHQDISEVSV